MVQQERDRRGPDSAGDAGGPGHLADRAQRWSDDAQVRPGFRERVEALVRDRWREPAIVLRLGDTDVGFAVPGRRQDGTVEGEQQVSQFFRGVLRGVGTAVVSVFSLANGGGAGRPFQREISVTGPAGAQVLDLADRLGAVKGPWLACSPSCVALVETGPTFLDPADVPPPSIVWEARGPGMPSVDFRKRTLTWPDGSSFRFPLHGRGEEQHLRRFVEPPGIVHWNGRPQ